MTIGQRIARDLFTNGAGQRATRLVMIDREVSGDIGGWSERAAATRIDNALATEWPEERAECVSMAVRPYIEEARLEVTGVSGAVDLARDPAVLRAAWKVITGEPTAGHYLLAVCRSDEGLDARVVAFETERQRAARLAREEGS